jgi:hypothetical protein
MCLRDVMIALRAAGLDVTEPQLRWAIKSGKVPRPPLDGSLRFDFADQHFREIRDYFRLQNAASIRVGEPAAPASPTAAKTEPEADNMPATKRSAPRTAPG